MMATMSNIERVQENIRRMQEQNAPANDVVGYLKSEGFTPTKFEAAVASSRKLGGPPVEAGFGRSVLQGLTLDGTKSDNIDQMITITDEIYY